MDVGKAMNAQSVLAGKIRSDQYYILLVHVGTIHTNIVLNEGERLSHENKVTSRHLGLRNLNGFFS